MIRSEIRRHCRDVDDRSMVPAYFAFVPSYPPDRTREAVVEANESAMSDLYERGRATRGEEEDDGVLWRSFPLDGKPRIVRAKDAEAIPHAHDGGDEG